MGAAAAAAAATTPAAGKKDPPGHARSATVRGMHGGSADSVVQSLPPLVSM
jgi:hypothetical protein